MRKNDDLIQVWNLNANGAEECGVIEKINQICPFVQFETSFYKRKFKYILKLNNYNLRTALKYPESDALVS